MARKIILCSLVIFIVILLFILIKALYVRSWFSGVYFSAEVAPLDAIDILITSAITLFLGWYFTKKITEQRYEKEFIIEDLKNIEQQINYIEKLTTSINSIELEKILELLNSLYVNIERFIKTVEILKFTCKDSNNLLHLYNILYKKATDIDGNALNVDGPIRHEIHNTCNSLIITTRRIISNINKF